MENLKVYRSINERIRKDTSYKERWGSIELGLITAWESGRTQSVSKYNHLIPYLGQGALPKLDFKGGHIMPFEKDDGTYKKPTYKFKYGVYGYLAQLQGILGQDLNITPIEGFELICGLTGVKTIFTLDMKKYK